MWFLEKIREGVENIPQDLGLYLGKSQEELSAKASLSNKLHSNILTPDKIPEFCLPPRLKRSLMPAPDRTAAHLYIIETPQNNKPALLHTENNTQIKHINTGGVVKTKPLPFSAEGYGLAGMYESPNTRRKESLFHSKSPSYLLERSVPRHTHRTAQNKTSLTLSGLLPLFPCKSLSETGSTESDTPSSNESSPCGSPRRGSPSLYVFLDCLEAPGTRPRHASGPLKGAVSCSSLASLQDEKRMKKRPVASPLSCNPPSPLVCSLTLAPPVIFPLDILHCQERRQREHILPLPGRGRIRLSAERTSTSSSPTVFTLRIRVVAVENLRAVGDPRPFSCALSLCLTPGKLQRQESATIRNCRSPVFNEDFFFCQLTQESLLRLELRMKVMDKSGQSALRRSTVLGAITEPLALLLPP
ncbi:C2 calcium-dependent domain-containing protein 4C [Aplochiton taeniatus]